MVQSSSTQQKKSKQRKKIIAIIVLIILLLLVGLISNGMFSFLFRGPLAQNPFLSNPTPVNIKSPISIKTDLKNTVDQLAIADDPQATPNTVISQSSIFPQIIKPTTSSNTPTTSTTPNISIPNQPNLPTPLTIISSLSSCDVICANITTTISSSNQLILERGIVYSTTPNPTITDNKVPYIGNQLSYTIEIQDMRIVNNYYVKSYIVTPSGTIYSNQIEINKTLSTPHNSEPADISEVFSNLAGEGTPVSPYIITNDWELQAMGQDLDAYYRLGNNIDARGTETWNSGLGFTPIGGDGYTDEPFTGTLNGNGYGIVGLTIDREGTSFNDGYNYYVGLFSRTNDAKIYDIVLQDNYILGKQHVGGIVGHASGETEIRNAVVDGVSWARYGLYGGGLIGSMTNGLIDNSITNGYVHGSGNIIGGLVGIMENGTITNSTSNADIDGGGNLGGLVGRLVDGVILNSCATGDIQGVRDEMNGKIGTAGGGFIGRMDGGIVQNSHATGNINLDESEAGGFVGGMYGGSIQNSYATGDVNVGVDKAGGFVGIVNGVSPLLGSESIEITAADINTPVEVGIHNSYATGDVIFNNIDNITFEDFTIFSEEGTAPFYIPFYGAYGGFVGENQESAISNNYSTGRVMYNSPEFPNPTTKGFTGKLVFINPNDADMVNIHNYWNIETSQQSTSADSATPLSTDQMNQVSSFNTWDFNTIWQSNGISAPTLQDNANCKFTCFKPTPAPPIPLDCISPPIGNGLLQYVDICAESYPGAGLVWNDLSPNNRDISLDPSIAYDSTEGGSLKGEPYTFINTDLSGDDSLANSTYMTWVKPVLDENSNTLISMNTNDQVDSFSNSVYIESGYVMVSSNSSTYNSLIDDYEYTDYSYNTGILLDPNEWYHLAVTNTVNEPIKLYINGNLVFTAPDTYPSNLINPPYTTSIAYLERGNISHISVYNRPLLLSEIQLFFNTTKDKFPAIGSVNYGI